GQPPGLAGGAVAGLRGDGVVAPRRGPGFWASPGAARARRRDVRLQQGRHRAPGRIGRCSARLAARLARLFPGWGTPGLEAGATNLERIDVPITRIVLIVGETLQHVLEVASDPAKRRQQRMPLGRELNAGVAVCRRLAIREA